MQNRDFYSSWEKAGWEIISIFVKEYTLLHRQDQIKFKNQISGKSKA